MSERDQTLMRTRCPECGTVFRVTSEQLRRKAGKVRCGQCQAVFNAFDHWLSEAANGAPWDTSWRSAPAGAGSRDGSANRVSRTIPQ